jgi:hypothetical protein
MSTTAISRRDLLKISGASATLLVVPLAPDAHAVIKPTPVRNDTASPKPPLVWLSAWDETASRFASLSVKLGRHWNMQRVQWRVAFAEPRGAPRGLDMVPLMATQLNALLEDAAPRSIGVEGNAVVVLERYLKLYGGERLSRVVLVDPFPLGPDGGGLAASRTPTLILANARNETRLAAQVALHEAITGSEIAVLDNVATIGENANSSLCPVLDFLSQPIAA